MERTLDQVNREYGLACAKLGDMVFKSETLDLDISQAKIQLAKLNKEARKFHADLAKQKAAELEQDDPVPPVEEAQPDA